MRANDPSSLNEARARHNFRLSREESTLPPSLSLSISLSLSFSFAFSLFPLTLVHPAPIATAKHGGSRVTRSTTIVTRLLPENCHGVTVLPLLGIRSLSPPHFYRRPSARTMTTTDEERDLSKMRRATIVVATVASMLRRCADRRRSWNQSGGEESEEEKSSFSLSLSLSLSVSLARPITNLRFDLSFSFI